MCSSQPTLIANRARNTQRCWLSMGVPEARVPVITRLSSSSSSTLSSSLCSSHLLSFRRRQTLPLCFGFPIPLSSFSFFLLLKPLNLIELLSHRLCLLRYCDSFPPSPSVCCMQAGPHPDRSDKQSLCRHLDRYLRPYCSLSPHLT